MIFHGEIWVVFNNLRSMWSPDESHRWLSKISEYSFSSFVNPPIGSTTVLAAHDHFFSGKAMQKTWIKRSTSAKVWDTTWDQRFLPLSSQKEMNRHGRSMNHPFLQRSILADHVFNSPGSMTKSCAVEHLYFWAVGHSLSHRMWLVDPLSNRYSLVI